MAQPGPGKGKPPRALKPKPRPKEKRIPGSPIYGTVPAGTPPVLSPIPIFSRNRADAPPYQRVTNQQIYHELLALRYEVRDMMLQLSPSTVPVRFIPSPPSSSPSTSSTPGSPGPAANVAIIPAPPPPDSPEDIPLVVGGPPPPMPPAAVNAEASNGMGDAVDAYFKSEKDRDLTDLANMAESLLKEVDNWPEVETVEERAATPPPVNHPVLVPGEGRPRSRSPVRSTSEESSQTGKPDSNRKSLRARLGRAPGKTLRSRLLRGFLTFLTLQFGHLFLGAMTVFCLTMVVGPPLVEGTAEADAYAGFSLEDFEDAQIRKLPRGIHPLELLEPFNIPLHDHPRWNVTQAFPLAMHRALRAMANRRRPVHWYHGDLTHRILREFYGMAEENPLLGWVALKALDPPSRRVYKFSPSRKREPMGLYHGEAIYKDTFDRAEAIVQITNLRRRLKEFDAWEGHAARKKRSLDDSFGLPAPIDPAIVPSLRNSLKTWENSHIGISLNDVTIRMEPSPFLRNGFRKKRSTQALNPEERVDEMEIETEEALESTTYLGDDRDLESGSVTAVETNVHQVAIEQPDGRVIFKPHTSLHYKDEGHSALIGSDEVGLIQPGDEQKSLWRAQSGLSLSEQSPVDPDQYGKNVFEAYDCQYPGEISYVRPVTNNQCNNLKPPSTKRYSEGVGLIILQKAANRRIRVRKCRLRETRFPAYCGSADHMTLRLRDWTLMRDAVVEIEDCRRMWDDMEITRALKPDEGMDFTLQPFALQANRTNKLDYLSHGKTNAWSGGWFETHTQVTCNGVKWRSPSTEEIIDEMVVYAHDDLDMMEDVALIDEQGVMTTFHEQVVLPKSGCELTKLGCKTETGTYIWDIPKEEDNCPMYIIRETTANETVVLDENGEEVSVFDSSDTGIRLVAETKDPLVRCGGTVYATNSPQLFVAYARNDVPDAWKRELPVPEISLVSYLNNQDSWLFHAVQTKTSEQLYAFFQARCRQQAAVDALEYGEMAAVQSSAVEGRTLSLGKGRFATATGEAWATYRCPITYVKALDKEECYQGLPVTFLDHGAAERYQSIQQQMGQEWAPGDPLFLEPYTRRLTSIAIERNCTPYMHSFYQNVHQNWIQATPSLFEAAPPKVVQAPSATHPKGIDPIGPNFHTMGLYDVKSIARMEAHWSTPRRRQSTLETIAKSSHRQHRGNPIIGGMQDFGIDAESLKEISSFPFWRYVGRWGSFMSIVVGTYTIGVVTGWIIKFVYRLIFPSRETSTFGRLILACFPWMSHLILDLFDLQKRKKNHYETVVDRPDPMDEPPSAARPKNDHVVSPSAPVENVYVRTDVGLPWKKFDSPSVPEKEASGAYCTKHGQFHPCKDCRPTQSVSFEKSSFDPRSPKKERSPTGVLSWRKKPPVAPKPDKASTLKRGTVGVIYNNEETVEARKMKHYPSLPEFDMQPFPDPSPLPGGAADGGDVVSGSGEGDGGTIERQGRQRETTLARIHQLRTEAEMLRNRQKGLQQERRIN